MQKYVLGFMFDELKEKVVLIRKSKPKWQEGFYNGVGGKVEDIDTSYEHAMVREFKEETGVTTYEYEWNKLLTMEEDGTFSVDVFYCFSDKWNKVKTMETEKVECFDVEYHWQYLRENTLSNVPWLIMACLDMDSQIGRLKLQAKYV